MTASDYKLDRFETRSLAEASAVSLTSRLETKFMLRPDTLTDLFEELCPHYFVIHSNNNVCTRYVNRYYDTPEFRFYHDHHNQHRERIKVRQRHYGDTGNNLLEIKHTAATGRIVKERLSRENNDPILSSTELDFLRSHLQSDPATLQPVLLSSYNRITLLSKTAAERVTLDLQLKLSQGVTEHRFDDLCILEVKQAVRDLSPVFTALKKRNQHSIALSKYCLGINYLYPSLKKNNFMPRLRAIEKLSSRNSL